MIGQLLNPHGFFYPEGSLGVFLLLTIFLGGGAAALAGRAIAVTWRPWWNVILYMMVLGAVVRFFHYSLFGGALLSIHYYVVDTMICLLAGFIGFRATRASQMATQYRWIYQSNGLLRWHRKQL